MKNAAKRVFTCKDRCGYSRTRSKFNQSNLIERGPLKTVRSQRLLHASRPRNPTRLRASRPRICSATEAEPTKIFANFWRARSRLYQNEFFQENMHLVEYTIWQHFSSSTRFASFCTAAISKFSQKIGLKNSNFREISAKKKIANVAKFAKFCQISKISA